VNVNYRYIYEDVDRHGNVRIYFWRGKGHKKVRVHDRVGSPSFHTRYPELMQGDGQAPPDAGRTPKANTLGWLCVQYFGSKNFKSLNRRTQYVRRRIIESMLVEPIAPDARDTFANFPFAAAHADNVGNTSRSQRRSRGRQWSCEGAACCL
jgi:hypothetical protein